MGSSLRDILCLDTRNIDYEDDPNLVKTMLLKLLMQISRSVRGVRLFKKMCAIYQNKMEASSLIVYMRGATKNKFIHSFLI